MKTREKQHRIALTVPKEIDADLTELSKLLKVPKTAIITEMLMNGQPYFKQALQVFKDIKSGQAQVAVDAIQSLLGGMSNSVNQAHIELGEMKGIINAKSK